MGQAGLQVRLLGTMDPPGLGALKRRGWWGGREEGAGQGHSSRAHVGHTENTTHEDGAPQGGEGGGGAVCKERVGSEDRER